MNDVGYKEYITGLCLLDKKIPFYNKRIRHFTVDEILTMGEDAYRELISVFALNKKCYLEDDNSDIGILDVLIRDKDSERIFDSILETLTILMDLDMQPIVVSFNYDNNPHIEINVNNDLYIDSDKFEQLRKIILYMNNIKELTKEVAKKNIALESDKKRFEKLFKGRERKAKKEKNDYSMTNMYNYIVHKQTNINYESVSKWSVFKLYNSFNILNIGEDYEFNRNILSSGMADLKKAKIPKFFNEMIKNRRHQ